MEFAIGIRKKYMNWVQNITDPGYYILKTKNAPLSMEESDFV
jgi:hypothetical protein